MKFRTVSNDVTLDGAVLRTTIARYSVYKQTLPLIFESIYLKLEPKGGKGKYAIAVLNSFQQKIGYIPILHGINQIEIFSNSFKNNLPIIASVVGIDSNTMTVTIELVFDVKAGFIKKSFKTSFKTKKNKTGTNQLSLF